MESLASMSLHYKVHHDLISVLTEFISSRVQCMKKCIVTCSKEHPRCIRLYAAHVTISCSSSGVKFIFNVSVSKNTPLPHNTFYKVCFGGRNGVAKVYPYFLKPLNSVYFLVNCSCTMIWFSFDVMQSTLLFVMNRKVYLWVSGTLPRWIDQIEGGSKLILQNGSTKF